MLDQHHYITVFVATRSNSPDMKSVFSARTVRFTDVKSNLRKKKVHRTNQGFNFLRGSFSNRDSVRALIQFSKERPFNHLKK